MKALYIPVGFLAVILGFSLWAGRYVDQRTDHWIAILDEVDAAAQQERWDEAADRLSSAYRDWDSSQSFFHTIMKHEDLDEAESLFAGAFAACREQDNEDFHITLAQLMCQLRLLAETQSVSIKNEL